MTIAYDGPARDPATLEKLAKQRQTELNLRYSLPAMLAERRGLNAGTIDPSAKVLTDDFAPVEALKAIEQSQSQMDRSAAGQQPVAGGPAVQAVLLVNAFFVGSVLMGFEMLGSRYLFPYFGGGIGTWAGLISTVLCALTIGYFVGGAVVDRRPSPRVIAISCGIAAAYLAVVPASADPLMLGIMNNIGDGPSGDSDCRLLLAAGAVVLPRHVFAGRGALAAALDA